MDHSLRAQVGAAFAALKVEQGAATWHDAARVLAQRAVISLDARAELRLVRCTAENMVRAGELQRVGSTKPAGSRHWHALYEPTVSGMPADEFRAQCQLTAAMAAWGELRISAAAHGMDDMQQGVSV